MEFAHTLKAGMESHLEAIKALLLTLREEQLALQKNHSEKINMLTQKKPALLSAVLQAHQNLLTLTKQQRLSDVIQHLNMPYQKELISLWSLLKNAIEEMSLLNAANGITLSSRITNIERTLSLLTQKPSSGSIVSYDAQGTLHAATRSTGQSKA